MNEKIDRRAKMTKNFLKNSLIELMKKKSIFSVTVKEVCENADVNRSTFYKHYKSVGDLYEEILNDITEDVSYIVKCSEKEGTLYSSRFVESILNYVEKKKDIFLVVLSDKGNTDFGEFVVRNTDKIIAGREYSELSKYCVYFITAGMSSIIWKWLSDENRASAHSLALLISNLLNNGIKRAYLFSR